MARQTPTTARRKDRDLLPASRWALPALVIAAALLSATATATITVPAQTKESISKVTPMRSDEMSVVVKPHGSLEVKADMKTGDHLIFEWASSAPMKMDMHGEKPDDGDRFTRYWMQSDMRTAQGAFTAPFDGHHGWYWRNRTDSEVTLKIRTQGFYEKLYIPK